MENLGNIYEYLVAALLVLFAVLVVIVFAKLIYRKVTGKRTEITPIGALDALPEDATGMNDKEDN